MTTDAHHQSGCACSQCGVPLTGPMRDVAMTWPDVVFALSAEERDDRTWVSESPRPDFVMLDRSRCFVRGLLPLPLEDGTELRYGVWLEVSGGDFRRIFEAWDDQDTYRRLRFRALLANALRPWGEATLGQVVEAAPRMMTERPYVVAAESDWLARVLADGWDNATHLAAVQALHRNRAST